MKIDRRSVRLALLLLALVPASASARVIHVKAYASGNYTGESWANAYGTLRTGLAAAQGGDEIWVAMGVYLPANGTDREAYFQMKQGVAMYGGFAGWESALDQRDWNENETILSGDIGVKGNKEDNSHCVVRGSSSATLDGFTISGANVWGAGGGMVNEAASPLVANCKFIGNSTVDEGGGMRNIDSSPMITNCIFAGNVSRRGGGMFNQSGAPLLLDCTFDRNRAETGGGLYNDGSSATLSGCTFVGNDSSGWSSGSGGGFYTRNSSPELTACSFFNNTAYRLGAGLYTEDGSPSITDCTFEENKARQGGGMFSQGGAPAVARCIFRNNRADNGYGGGMRNHLTGAAVTFCTFDGNSADYGGGMNNSGSVEMLVTNCIFTLNGAQKAGGAMVNSEGTVRVTDCTFSSNHGEGWGGAILNDKGTHLFQLCDIRQNSAGTGAGIHTRGGPSSFINCEIADNMAISTGGGVYINGAASFEMCMIRRNRAFSGGGIYADSGVGNAQVTDCTVSDNIAGGSGGGIDIRNGSPTFTSCRILGNSVMNSLPLSGGGINIIGPASPRFQSCVISGNTAGQRGGGVYHQVATAQFEACLLSGNRAEHPNVSDEAGGGMCNVEGQPTLANCTVAANRAGTIGGGLYSEGSASLATLTNCILWDNDAPAHPEVRKNGGSIVFLNSDIEGSGGSGAGWNYSMGIDAGANLATDPRFVNPAAPRGPDDIWQTADDGFRPGIGSPCIDAGRIMEQSARDILGKRWSLPPEIGAYPFDKFDRAASADWFMYR